MSFIPERKANPINKHVMDWKNYKDSKLAELWGGSSHRRPVELRRNKAMESKQGGRRYKSAGRSLKWNSFYQPAGKEDKGSENGGRRRKSG